MKKTFCLILSLVLMLGVLSGCGPKGNGGDIDESKLPEPGKFDDALTITAWCYTDDYKNYFSTLSDAPVVQYLNKMYNCTVKFEQPAMGSETELFNLMVGGGEYTDVIEITYSPDNVSVLYENGVIRDLAPYVEKYMPNYYKILQDPKYAHYKQSLYDPDGHLFTISGELFDVPQLIWGGLGYRADILNTMTGGYVSFPSGKDYPATVEDWEYMLPLFQAYFAAAGMANGAPLILPAQGWFPTGELLDGFGCGGAYQVKDGVVSYGPATDEFYNYLVKMHEWYEKGWIYTDFAARVNDLFYMPNTELTYGGAAGAFFAGNWTLADQMSMPEYGLFMEVKACPAPLDTEHGQTGNFGTCGMVSNGGNPNIAGWVVSTKCSPENMVRFMQWADYLYSDEGAMIKKYGFTGDLAANDPLYQKLGVPEGTYWFDENGNFVRHPKCVTTEVDAGMLAGFRLPGFNPNSYENNYSEDFKIEADKLWSLYGNANNFPAVVPFTTEESSTTAKLYPNFNDYSVSMVPKFIMGTEPLTPETYAAYQAQMNALGVEEAVKIYQAAYDRFLGK